LTRVIEFVRPEKVPMPKPWQFTTATGDAARGTEELTQ
jgi:hypothetical protein